MEPGDRLLLYTDGVTDAADSSGEFFGEDRLIKLMCEKNTLSADEFCRDIFTAIKSFSTVPVFDDDITFVVVDFGLPDSSETVSS